MNREIKFRGWWTTPDGHYAPPEMLVDLIPGDCLRWKAEGQNIEVMQFTGLKDKNGVEIYEGDILRLCYWEYDDEPELNSYTTHEVIWGCPTGDYPAFDLKPSIEEMNGLQAAVGHFGEDCPIWCEVIGNIYENPELLESK